MSNILNEGIKLISRHGRPKKRSPEERFGRGDWLWCVLFWHRKCNTGKEGRNCLWEEAMETAATSGWEAGVRNITWTGVTRYVWLRCITGQSIDGKINWDRGGYGFSGYWEEGLVDCQNINSLNEVQAPLKSVRVSPSTSAGLKCHSLCFINCFGGEVASENVKIQIGWY